MNKRPDKFLLLVLAVVVIFGFLAVAQIYAEEKGQAQAKQENGVVRFFKNLINWPFAITKNASEAAARTTQKAVTTVTTTGSSAVETVTGKPQKIKDVIVEPVKGSAETAYTAVTETVKAPIKGTEEAFESKETEAGTSK